MRQLNPRMIAADGFSMSVQANEYAYCLPRDNEGPYTHVECGFPSSKPLTQALLDYAELCGTDDYTETVYGYVPIEIVLAEFEAHGGLVGNDVKKLQLK